MSHRSEEQLRAMRVATLLPVGQHEVICDPTACPDTFRFVLEDDAPVPASMTVTIPHQVRNSTH